MKRLSILLPFILATTSHAIEPWADQALPVKDGLALWLDAGAEVAAAKEGGATFEKDNVPTGVWHDGSGHKRDARQEDAGAQPKLGTAYPAKMFAFDGQAQHFVVKADGLEFNEATVVVFARA